MREWIDRVLVPSLTQRIESLRNEELIGDGGLYDPEDDDTFIGSEDRYMRRTVLGEQHDERINNCGTDFIADSRIVCSHNTDAADRENCRASARAMAGERCVRTPNSLLHVD